MILADYFIIILNVGIFLNFSKDLQDQNKSAHTSNID